MATIPAESLAPPPPRMMASTTQESQQQQQLLQRSDSLSSQGSQSSHLHLRVGSRSSSVATTPTAPIAPSSGPTHTPTTSDTPKGTAVSIPRSVRLQFHWEGYLQKRSDWLKHWETYYFVLRGRQLYCYLSEEDAWRQPEKSKIKKGKFGFSNRVSLVKAWDVEESTPFDGGQTNVHSTKGSSQSGANTESAHSIQQQPGSSPLFRFTFETDKGHQLHFRTNSEASKQVWLHYAVHAIEDHATDGSLYPDAKRMRTDVDQFYEAYAYLYAALSEQFSANLMELQEQWAQQGSASSGLAASSGSSSAGKKTQTTYFNVGTNQALRKAHRKPPTSHLVMRLFSYLSPDVILRSNFLPMVPFDGKYRGYAGVLEFFTRLSQSVRYENFTVERVTEEQDEFAKQNRILVVAGRETMQVRYNQTTFMQQWTHKLHFKPTGNGRASRWEIFGDVVASSVVFKAPGFSTSLTLPSLSERIRESFVGGYVVAVNLQQITDVRTKGLQKDKFFVRCSLDTNELDGVWHTEAQSRSVAPLQSNPQHLSVGSGPQPNGGADQESSSLVYVYNQLLYLQFDRLSRDDNTVLLIEFCRDSSHEVVARTHVNLASFLNLKTSRRRGRKKEDATSYQHYVLSNDHQSFFGKLVLDVSITSLSSARQERQSWRRRSARKSFRWGNGDISSDEEASVNDLRHSFHEASLVSNSGANSSSIGQALRARSGSRLSLSMHEPEEVMHQFVINGVRYQLAEKYRMVKIVGKGTYGEVIAASDFVNGGTYAIKKLGQFLRHPKVAMLALREIKLMNELGSHPCLMAIHELQKPLDYEHFEDLYIIQPLMETDLCRIIHSKEHLSDDQIQYFIYQLLCGIHNLHSANVLHRDLKPSNILVNSDCQIKICDFGLARHVNDQDLAEGLSEYVVTRWYRAPELLLANAYTKAIDMWSIGCIFGELLGRRVLFPGTSYVDQLKLIIEVVGTPTTFSFCDNPVARRYAGRQFLLQSERVTKVEWSSIFPEANPDALDLLDKLLQFDPAHRITAKEALEHSYVSQWRDPRWEQPCRAEVDSLLAEFDYTKLSSDPTQLKRLLYEEVLRKQSNASAWA